MFYKRPRQCPQIDVASLGISPLRMIALKTRTATILWVATRAPVTVVTRIVIMTLTFVLLWTAVMGILVRPQKTLVLTSLQIC